jgi:hypothetical protein
MDSTEKNYNILRRLVVRSLRITKDGKISRKNIWALSKIEKRGIHVHLIFMDLCIVV